MKMHAIIEIEEGTMNVVVGGRDGGRTRVVRSLRMPLADLGTATVENALRTIGIAPPELLVLPKLFALMIALPLLSMTTDMMSPRCIARLPPSKEARSPTQRDAAAKGVD